MLRSNFLLLWADLLLLQRFVPYVGCQCRLSWFSNGAFQFKHQLKSAAIHSLSSSKWKQKRQRLWSNIRRTYHNSKEIRQQAVTGTILITKGVRQRSGLHKKSVHDNQQMLIGSSLHQFLLSRGNSTLLGSESTIPLLLLVNDKWRCQIIPVSWPHHPLLVIAKS